MAPCGSSPRGESGYGLTNQNCEESTWRKKKKRLGLSTRAVPLNERGKEWLESDGKSTIVGLALCVEQFGGGVGGIQWFLVRSLCSIHGVGVGGLLVAPDGEAIAGIRPR